MSSQPKRHSRSKIQSTGATIKDLAKALNMSATTISRALRGRPGMTKKTRDTVLATAKRMGYVRNAAGAILSTGRSHSIMFVVPDMAQNIYSLYQMDVLGGLAHEASRRGYSITVVPESMLRGTGQELFDSFRSFRVDGAVLLLVHAKEPDWNLTELPYPIVVVNRIIDRLTADFVVADDQRGAYEATKCLIERGHRDIALISGPVNNFNAIRRSAGFKDTLRAYGFKLDRRLILAAPSISQEGGFQAASALLNAERPFTAVFCGVDILAAGALQAFKLRGLRVPQDLSVVGFDDDSFASLMDPPLTTVRKPRYEMGQAAAQLLIERIERHAKEGSVVRSLATNLVVRESVAGPRS